MCESRNRFGWMYVGTNGCFLWMCRVSWRHCLCCSADYQSIKEDPASRTSFISSSVALQPGVGLDLLYNTPPSLLIPCSVSPFVYSHLSQVRGHVIHPSHFWSSSSSCCIQLSVQHLFFGIAVSCILSIWPSHGLHHLPWLQHSLNVPCAKCQAYDSRPLSPSGIHYIPRLIIGFRNN